MNEICRLRAVVATYRPTLQAFTLAISPEELLRLRGGADEAPAESTGATGATGATGSAVASTAMDPHLHRLRDAVMACGLALPNAIVVAVSGGRMQCESDHLYALEMRPAAGDALIVLEGHERLAQLARGERSHFKTLVTAVLCHTVIESASDADASVVELAAYQTSSTSRSKWPARM